ncbi:MAG: DUF2277 domain-containing protein [Pseudomonadota bacterium]
MCRNIRTLFNFEPQATEEEIHDAALQFVCKISGTRKPSKVNEQAFDRAVNRISGSVRELLDGMETAAAPRNREKEAEKARQRAIARFS